MEMTEIDVIGVLQLFSSAGVEIWIDGGWAVDALVSHQTRTHEDLDIAIEGRFVNLARSTLEGIGFADVARDDTSTWNFVMGDSRGRTVDFHVIELDDEGNGRYGPAVDEGAYPVQALTGCGNIGGRSVRCISLEGCLLFRSGWELRPRDCQDLHTLADYFDIELPEDYLVMCT